jgi:hypothetical protein
MKLNPAFFVPGEKHVCMFCNVPLAKLEDGKLKPLGNKVCVLLTKTFPGTYIINCCKDCAKRVDFKDQAVLDEIHENVVQCKESIDRLSGLTEEQILALRPSRNADPPVADFHIVEENIIQRAKNIQTHLDRQGK